MAKQLRGWKANTRREHISPDGTVRILDTDPLGYVNYIRAALNAGAVRIQQYHPDGRRVGKTRWIGSHAIRTLAKVLAMADLT